MPDLGVQPIVTVGLCATASASPVIPVSVNVTLDLAASANETIGLVNTTQGAALNNYGMLPLSQVGNNNTNALVAFVTWNAAEVNPVSNLSDDAHNFWIHLGTSPNNGGMRCSVWIAPNAQPVQCVSVGLSWYAESVCALVCEMSALPNWVQIDGTPVSTGISNMGSSLTLTYGTAAAQSDIVFALIANGNNLWQPQRPGGWQPLGQVTINDPAGAGGLADCGLSAMYQIVPPGTTPTATWTVTGSPPTQAAAAVMVGLSLSPTAPVQKNPNWPGLHVEMAMGYNPGDPTQMPAWTDVTPRLLGEPGATTLSTSRGRQYESESPEAGSMTLQLNNHDGALTPPGYGAYANQIRLGTPVRAWATWNNRYYPIQMGYTARDPQTWPDPQFGFAPWEAPDALDPLSNSALPSALAGEILLDSPYLYVPCGETYLQNGAGGFPLANLSRTNQRPMTCLDAHFLNADGSQNARYLQTGVAWQVTTTGQVQNFLGLPGDQATAIGVAVTTDQTNAIAVTPQAGAFYQAPDMPQTSLNGLTVEFWAIVDKTLKAGSGHFVELLRLSGPPGNYYTNSNRGVRLLLRVDPNGVYLMLGDYVGNTFSRQVTATVTDGNPHHYSVTVLQVSGNYQFQLYLDGTLQGSWTSSGVTVLNDWNYLGTGGVIHNDGGVAYSYNYTLGHVALFGSVLPASRIKAHYNAAWTGSSGDDSVTRMSKILTWGGFGLQRACAPASPSPMFGPADQVAGASAADAGNTVATTDGGMMFVDGSGNITWWPRTFLYNRPVKFTFGDNPAGGEIAYDPGEQYGFDNTFLNNMVSSQRQSSSSSNGVLAVAADQASQQQYFTRSLSQTIETTSDEDAYDLVNWHLSKYKQPALRVEQIVIDPASNPAIWPVALGIEQGDVVRLIRRPIGGVTLNQIYIVQMVSHSGGPNNWKTTINLVPYDLEAAVLQCDQTGYNVVGSNGIGW